MFHVVFDSSPNTWFQLTVHKGSDILVNVHGNWPDRMTWRLVDVDFLCLIPYYAKMTAGFVISTFADHVKFLLSQLEYYLNVPEDRC